MQIKNTNAYSLTDTYSLTNHGHYLRRRGDITVWGAYTMTECFRANYDNIPNEITSERDGCFCSFQSIKYFFFSFFLFTMTLFSILNDANMNSGIFF